jgi:sec-independent protein translocase protein TatB
MFDIGGGELLVIGIVALVVIGPKELPGLLRTAGTAMGKVRRMAAEFRSQFDEAMREAELEEAKKAFRTVDETARSATTSTFNPLDTIRNEIKAVKEEMKGPQPVETPPAAEASTVAANAPTPVAAVELPPPPAPPPVAIETAVAAAEAVSPPEGEPIKPKRTRKAKDETGPAA